MSLPSASSSSSSTPGSGYETDATEVSECLGRGSSRGSGCSTPGPSCVSKYRTLSTLDAPGASEFHVLVTERSVFQIRREADFWKTIYGLKKNVLSSPALSKLNERWTDLSKTALKMEALFDKGEEQYVTMETAPLDTAMYVEEGDEAKIELLQRGLQSFRQGQVVRDLKQLKRPSRSSANSEEDTEVFDALVADHEKYAVLVQSFSDTLTPEEFCQWRNPDAISEAKRQKMQILVDTELELWARIDDYQSKQNRVSSISSYGRDTGRRGWRRRIGSRFSAACKRGRTSMRGSRSSATSVH